MQDKKDAIDVEFETVIQGDSKTPLPSPSQDAETDDQLTVFGKNDGSTGKKQMSLTSFTLVAAISTMAAFYLAGGHALFGGPSQDKKTVPEQAIVEDSLLQLKEVTTTSTKRNGGSILTIRATVSNQDKVARNIPTILVHLGEEPSTQRLFRIKRGEILNPGESLIFTNTLPIGDAPTNQTRLSFSE